MAENKSYDREYKAQAVKPAKEIGQAKAARELGVPKNTLYGWGVLIWAWAHRRRKAR